ncbi:MAG TPA: translocation/assembly module TamB domain-containing protein [Arachidicoccus sp.]
MSLTLFNRMNMDGTLIRDKKKDTLLYAGALKVRITDWFFLKKNIDLNYIGLEDAVINLNRKDSVWNYQFLVDYFSSPNKKDTTPNSTTLNLKKVDIQNLRFVQNDLWVGQRMSVALGSLTLDANSIDFNKLDFKIKMLEMDKPLFSMQNFDGLEPLKKNQPKVIVKDTGLYFNSAGMHVHADSIQIINGDFAMLQKDSSYKPYSGFDADAIELHHINLSAGDFLFNKDTLTASLQLTTIERSGFDIKNLSADFKLTPRIMEFKHLDLRTANSHVQNYYAMKFKDFAKDMSYFNEKVTLDAHFNDALVSSDDIGYFAPYLKTWKKRWAVSGNMLGLISNFKVNKMSVRDQDGMLASGDLLMRGLPEIDTTLIDVENLNATTTYQQLLPIAPQLKGMANPDLSALGKVNYTGFFKGTIHNFTTSGNMNSALGADSINLTMTLPDKGEPTYKGKLVTQQFNIGKFINNDNLGNIAFNGNFNGTSFDIDKMRANIDGHFNSFDANGYAYQNIDVNGTIQKKLFTGDLKVDDPNASLISNVAIDLNGEVPHFNVLGDLVNLDMQKTQLVKGHMVLTGLFDLNFTGSNIDNFIGTAKVLNVSLTKDSSTLNFDSLSVSASIDSNKMKVLSVDNNQFDATIRGQYSILDLPTTFQTFLSNYYPALFKKPEKVPRNQHFTLELHTRDFDNYANLIDSNLHGLDSVTLIGAVNTQDSGDFYLNAEIPFAQYKHYKLQNTIIEGKGNLSNIDFDGKIERLYLGDSSYFPNTNLSISSQNNHSVIQLNTGSNNAINEINLAADVYNLDDGVKIDFRPSYFVINDKKWDLENEGELVITKNYTSAKNVKFTQGFQELTVETAQGKRDTTSNNLIVRLSKVNIGDFTSIFMASPRIEGLVSGRVSMLNFYGNFSISDSLQFEQFRFNDDSIGNLKSTGFYSGKTKNIHFIVSSDNPSYNFDANGNYSLSDSVENPMDIVVNMKQMRINILDQFLDNLFSNIDGYGTGKLEIVGKPSNFRLLGSASISKAALDVNYTRVRYFVDTAAFTFTDNSIEFGSFTMKDKYGNKANVNGTLYHHSFNNMSFDFSVKSGKILAIDTKAPDNPLFYGKAIAKAEFTLKGTQDNMQMTITATPADTSNINILTTTTTASSSANFIVFKKYGKALKDSSVLQNANIDLWLNLTANNKANINVILDPLTGDAISATGNGTLKIHVPPTGNVTMNGKYNIEKGNYNFSFQSLIKKPFVFKDGDNNSIEWTGDPENANLHIDAQYTATQVSLSPLISSQSSLSNSSGMNDVRGYRGDVYVIVQLRGKLLKPDIGFLLDFPIGSTAKSDPDFALFLSRMQSDENEMLKQVAYLIAFNAFAPYGQSGGNSTNLASAGVNTISSLITNELNGLFSNALTKLTGDKGLHLELGTQTYSSSDILGTNGSNKLDRQSVNFKLYQSLANDKIILSFGSNLDFGLGGQSTAAQNSTFQFLPDFSAQFVLSRDRRLHAIIFSRSSLGAAGGATGASIGRENRYGVSISYTRDFEKLFGDKSKYREIKMRNDTMSVSQKESTTN